MASLATNHLLLAEHVLQLLEHLHPDGVEDSIEVRSQQVAVERQQIVVQIVHQVANCLTTVNIRKSCDVEGRRN